MPPTKPSTPVPPSKKGVSGAPWTKAVTPVPSTNPVTSLLSTKPSMLASSPKQVTTNITGIESNKVQKNSLPIISINYDSISVFLFEKIETTTGISDIMHHNKIYQPITNFKQENPLPNPGYKNKRV